MFHFHFNPSAVGERGQTLYCYEVEGPRGQKLMCFQHAFRQERGGGVSPVGLAWQRAEGLDTPFRSQVMQQTPLG